MNGLIYTNSYEGRARNLQTKIKMLLGFLASGISGLVAEYIVAIDVTRVRFPADACVFVVSARPVRACSVLSQRG